MNEKNRGGIIPGVAQSWSYDASTLTYTFRLREDASWVIMKKAYKSILGDDADKLLNVDQKENSGDDYGAREKDLESLGDDDFDSDGDEESTDYDDGGDDDYGGE